MQISFFNANDWNKLRRVLDEFNGRGYDQSYSKLFGENGLSIWFGYCCHRCSNGSYIYFNDIKSIVSFDTETSVLPMNLWVTKEKFAEEGMYGINIGPWDPKLRLAPQSEVKNLGFPIDTESFVIVIYSDEEFGEADGTTITIGDTFIVANSVIFEIGEEPKITKEVRSGPWWKFWV